MFQRMLTGALFAGCAAGLIAALLHFAFVQEVILLGEGYETGELTHFSGSALEAPADHAHEAGAADDHVQGAEAADPSALTRNGLTVLFTILIYVSYAGLLVAGFGLAETLGKRVGAVEGLLWGIAGFVSFQLAPALGLPPELPGTVAADLGDRQVWWWGAVALTGTALALLAYGHHAWKYPLAVGMLALPHIIGAPTIDEYYGVAPPEVGAMFSARVLGVGLAVWAVLGWVAGQLWERSRTA
ncbi:CbtA family protein [Sedimentimonas flavescens]|nr:CbtA family protein [Sedimentimonas flavescens]MBW0158022.1 CbtA family protein [Sedimentimonas flavescens]MCT2539852.1 CbtA family protein [Sedimentimonas flavescens]